jgi:hypothetical protein
VTKARTIFDKRLREFDVGIFNQKPPILPWEFLKKKKDFVNAKSQRAKPGRHEKRMLSFLREIDRKTRKEHRDCFSRISFDFTGKTLEGWPLEKILFWRSENKKRLIAPAELRKIEFKELPLNEKKEIDLHRPYIDSLEFGCQSCKGKMKRLPLVVSLVLLLCLCLAARTRLPAVQQRSRSGSPGLGDSLRLCSGRFLVKRSWAIPRQGS